MEFSEFAARAREIEDESADLETVSLVADLLRDANDDLAVLARFVQGRVFPAYDSTTLDIGPSLCYGALARAAGPNVGPEDVEERLADVGEIGAVAASYDLGGQRGLAAFGEGSADLTVREVDSELRALAAAAGSGSEDRKLDLLFGLFNRCSPEEARYLARLVLSEMRIGVGEGTVRDAIVEAFDVPEEPVERALQVSNDYGRVAEVARDGGADGLAGLTLEVGRPVQAMLAQSGAVADVLEEWGEVGVEWKYDGARIQLHHDPTGEVRAFSRNMEEITDALPEVVEFADERLDAPAILDGEVVAVDGNGAPLPFQEVLRRFRRKHDVAAAREAVAVRPVFFDCLHADGEDLLDDPLVERHDRLIEQLGDGDEAAEGLSRLWITDDPDEIAAIEADALEAGHEGVMLKKPDSAYSPGRRGRNWRKRKPDVETLDLVVTGAEWGEGRRAQFLGTFELSVRSEGGFETIGKVATGVSDEDLADLTDLLEPHVLAERGQAVELRPAVVFEVGYEEIQRSPTYGSGYALRFPRFLAVRSDKPIEEAASLADVRRLVGDRS
ncbi:ATP-dependent DNA ligase LigA [Halalkalicoccus sp. NIPERK01]|uniref:ATP-dependent DNA ligase LigA n=1 Tax=Halalkalicoccus sp. NIPERK01 TaxID=3053469 RepID=UPI00256F14F5|nr:ATP-dependent DNA ligase LigA [Halalkalicoccus sp. NIPERK01]MDL5363719.1 ATP-dependent DNA ligase LigA [Halalkalicoccus sp. NIPERK01]